MRNIFIPIAILLFASACFEELPEQNEEKKGDKIHEVLVLEVIHTSSYTYLKVTSDRGENWLAVPKTEAKPGDVFYHTKGMPMKNFRSRELDRNFDLVLFLESVYKSPDEIKQAVKKPNSTGSNLSVKKDKIKIEPVEGGITIAELFSNKDKYKDKSVKIRGKVTKFNANIMNTNWIHLQDGTDYNGNFDLVVTSKAKFKVGDIVTIEGQVSLDKDFGHGYVYALIIEDANAKIAMK